jgi:hypothetical protein
LTRTRIKKTIIKGIEDGRACLPDAGDRASGCRRRLTGVRRLGRGSCGPIWVGNHFEDTA